MVRVDHLVVAALDLEEGARWLEHKLGAPLQPGGVHAAMGTHNRLLKLAGGEHLYLELIAVDPTAAAPRRPRWFGLDDAAMRTRLTERPRLVHWVVRSDDIARDATLAHGDILAMQRGDYRWRITVPADGSLPGEGLIPSLIQWDTAVHPAERLPESSCTLMKLEGLHHASSSVPDVLERLGLARSIALFPASTDEAAQLIAYIKTSRGLIELD